MEPLAHRVRPTKLEEFVGQEEVLGKEEAEKIIEKAIKNYKEEI